MSGNKKRLLSFFGGKKTNDTIGTPDTNLWGIIKRQLRENTVVQLAERMMVNEPFLCSDCGNSLQRYDNMILVIDKDGATYGLNGYYCENCNLVHISAREETGLEEELDGYGFDDVAISVLKNFSHNSEHISDAAPIAPTIPEHEMQLRALIDRLREVNEEKSLNIAKRDVMHNDCLLCNGKLYYSDTIATLEISNGQIERDLKGSICENRDYLYIQEESLDELLAEKIHIESITGIKISNKEAEKLERLLNDGKTLYIHQGNIICLNANHNVISVTAVLPAVSTGEMTEININYCIECDKCFISETVYNQHKNNGILPAIKFARISPDGTYPNPFDEARLAEESALHLLGYNVGQQDDFSDSYRQNLLANIMDSRALSKQKIGNHLTMLINTNITRRGMQTAVGKWERDLEFVERYNINRQRRVTITNVRPYTQ